MRTGLFAPANAPDIFTFHAAHELLPPGLSAAIVKESRLGRLPAIRQVGHDPGRWRYLLPYMPHYFRRLPLDDYELVIASSHACAVNARPRPEATYVCYCYTPIRYAWMPATDPRHSSAMKGAGLRAFSRYLRRLDLEASKRPDSYVAISSAVRERIRRFYGRDAVVIHPPVEVDDFRPDGEKEPGRFLWVHRLVDYKRPEVVAEAFRGLPYALTMVGVGPLEERLRARLPPNVELRKWVPRAQLVALFERAAGFVHVAEEDFGISMAEALAAGTPVVALDAGGARDIIRPGEDGILVAEATVGAVRAAVEELARRRWDGEALAARARQFSRARFLDDLARHIATVRQAKASPTASRAPP